MPVAPSATYCRACGLRARIAPNEVIPEYVSVCRCVVPVPYTIVVDQGKPPALNPRGPRKKKFQTKVASSEQVVSQPSKKLKLSDKIRLLVHQEVTRKCLNKRAAAKAIGVTVPAYQKFLAGEWVNEESLVAFCNFVGYDLGLIERPD